MKRRIVLLIGLGLVFPALAGDPLDIAGAVASQKLTLTAGQTLSQILFVQAVDGRGASGVTARVNPLAGAGQLIAVMAVWVADGKETGANKAQEFPGLAQHQLKLSAVLPKAGKYTTTIDLLYGGSRHSYKLEVDRAEGPSLSLRDKEVSSETGELKLETAIQSAGLAESTGVTVEAHPLIGPDGRQSALTAAGADGKPLPEPLVVPVEGLPLKLTARLPVPGKYTGTVDLVYGSQRQQEKLTITRTDVKLPVTIRPIESAEADVWPWIFYRDATLHVVLEGLRNEDFEIERPLLPSFARKESEKVNKSAIHGPIDISRYDSQGKPIGLSVAGSYWLRREIARRQPRLKAQRQVALASTALPSGRRWSIVDS